MPSNNAKMAPPSYQDIPLGNMSTGQPGVAQRGGGRGIEFFKPRNGFKVYNRVLLGVAVVFMAAMIALGVALGQEKARNDKLAHFYSGTTPVLGLTGMDLWNSTDCTTPNGNCTALLSKNQVNSCFQLVWDVCHADYDNHTHPIPAKNASVFANNPQCTQMLFMMHCQWESDGARAQNVPCAAMMPFCEIEFIPQSEIPPPETTPTLISISGMVPVTMTTVATYSEEIATNTAGGTTTLLPATTETFTFMTLTPSADAGAVSTPTAKAEGGRGGYN